MEFNHTNFASYQPAEAARLTGVSSQRIKRWLEGYTSGSGTSAKNQPPLWNSRYSEYDDCYFGFLDLIEIRFVDAFVKAGLSIQAVRTLLSRAREIAESDYPLSTHQFKTDGRTLFLEVWGSDDAKAIDVKNGQLAFHAIVKPSFVDLEFDSNSVTKWYVSGRNKQISIDPNLAFGQPVVDQTSIPTARLWEAYQADGDVKSVARQFEISLRQVKHAIEFEHRLASQN
ncbi:DUF433 domain-containing protein [Sphingorhabdus arenilitoris]|uniref:DUF433 domain-containing protein n=1 Tax=Sphingorhabdus arenilitoris TaxID=1490041 RepID=A0ABV8RD26_9SPHN